jgi:UDP-galactopyranose mutase
MPNTSSIRRICAITKIKNKMPFDYLIVGAGLSGATAARLLKDAGKGVLVVEKNPHVGGNCHTTLRDGVVVHEHGPHIFHTSNAKIESFVKRFANWLPYRHKVMAVGADGRVYSMPFNMATFEQMWGRKLDVETLKENLERRSHLTPTNLRDEAIKLVGPTGYCDIIKGYTEKQWGAKCEDLPVGIISRLPVRYTYDDNYYYDSFQGVPEGGYTPMIERMLEGIRVWRNVDVFDNFYYDKTKKVIYTGKIDELCGYELGELPYRSLRFETEVSNYDYGCAQVNFCGNEPYTRITTHKYFEGKLDVPNWISREYPMSYKRGDVPYYPINTPENNALWRKYKNLVKKEMPNVLLLGRLAEYKYLDMDKAIHSAMNLVEKELK